MNDEWVASQPPVAVSMCVGCVVRFEADAVGSHVQSDMYGYFSDRSSVCEL